MALIEIFNPDWELPTNVINHRKQPKAERECVNIYFSNFTESMTTHCFDEDGDMTIVIREGKNKASYRMNGNEVKELKKWLIENLKNN